MVLACGMSLSSAGAAIEYDQIHFTSGHLFTIRLGTNILGRQTLDTGDFLRRFLIEISVQDCILRPDDEYFGLAQGPQHQPGVVVQRKVIFGIGQVGVQDDVASQVHGRQLENRRIGLAGFRVEHVTGDVFIVLIRIGVSLPDNTRRQRNVICAGWINLLPE